MKIKAENQGEIVLSQNPYLYLIIFLISIVGGAYGIYATKTVPLSMVLIFFGIELVVVLGIFGFFLKQYTVTFTKSTNECLLKSSNLLGTQIKKYPLSQIQEVFIDSMKGSKNYRVFRINLRINGEIVPLSRTYNMTENYCHNTAEKIKKFIGLAI